jgi:signal transduction histidine kinase/ActR/RegA family two-component response regulator
MADALARVSDMLVRVRDVGRVSQRLVDEARTMFGSLGALLCRVDAQGTGLHAVAVSGEIGQAYDSHLTFAAGMGMPGLALLARSFIVSHDVLTDPRIRLTAAMRSIIERAPFRAALAVPLVLDEEAIIGTLCILDGPGRVFTPEDARFAQAVAHQGAIALDNARLNDEADRARAAADAANHAKDAFLATLGHELRNPLNAMFGWARLLRSGTLDAARTEHALQAIERNAVHQSRLIRDLLDVSRIIAGKMHLDVQAVSLAVVITEAVEALEPEADAKGVRVETRIDRDAGLVLGDPLRLRQVVTNLLGNAIKFSHAGGVVGVEYERDGVHARITVADRGQGIDREFLPHVFERFRQAESGSSRAHAGLGLGLTIVLGIVELHGGTVVAASEGRGSGATFIVELPIMAVLEPLVPAGPAPSLDASGQLTGIRVLAVDDHDDSRNLTGTILQQCGADVTLSTSALDALKILRERRVDVVVSDLAMPDVDGYDFIRGLRDLERDTRRRRTPAVALTGYAASEDRARALSAGFNVYLVKPVDPDQLVAVISATARDESARGAG